MAKKIYAYKKWKKKNKNFSKNMEYSIAHFQNYSNQNQGLTNQDHKKIDEINYSTPSTQSSINDSFCKNFTTDSYYHHSKSFEIIESPVRDPSFIQIQNSTMINSLDDNLNSTQEFECLPAPELSVIMKSKYRLLSGNALSESCMDISSYLEPSSSPDSSLLAKNK